MSKKYEYLVVLTQTHISGTSVENFSLLLDHEITFADIEDIGDKQSGVLRKYAVTNYKLLKTTGTFTYLFMAELVFRGRSPAKITILKEFDHKIIASTIRADFEQAEGDYIREENLSKLAKATILSYQEIPDE